MIADCVALSRADAEKRVVGTDGVKSSCLTPNKGIENARCIAKTGKAANEGTVDVACRRDAGVKAQKYVVLTGCIV